MKKGIIAAIAAIVVAGGVGGGYLYTQKQAEAKAYEEKVSAAISSLAPIEVYENEDLPTISDEFAGTEDVIDINSIEPDISNVYTSEPGTYEVNYTFTDTNGTERTTTVACTVKPELASHVEGMTDIEIDRGDDVPEEAEDITYDEYVDSVTMNTENVDNTIAGIYDISYTILGTDGDMKTVDGYTCTVNEIATPTPSPTPSPTPEPETEEETEIETETETETEIETEADTDEAMGNVEVQETVVETGDENNIIAIAAVIVVCIAAAAGVVIYKKKKETKEN